MPSEDFFDLIMKSQVRSRPTTKTKKSLKNLFKFQSSRLEDQRSSLVPKQNNQNNTQNDKNLNHVKFPKQQAITVPPNDDDFFSLIQRLQSRRLDEQRSEIPKSFQSSNHGKVFP